MQRHRRSPEQTRPRSHRKRTVLPGQGPCIRRCRRIPRRNGRNAHRCLDHGRHRVDRCRCGNDLGPIGIHAVNKGANMEGARLRDGHRAVCRDRNALALELLGLPAADPIDFLARRVIDRSRQASMPLRFSSTPTTVCAEPSSLMLPLNGSGATSLTLYL